MNEIELEERLMAQEFAEDILHDEAIERGKACANCSHCTMQRLPHNWWKEMFYCHEKHDKTQKYGCCEKWEEKDDSN